MHFLLILVGIAALVWLLNWTESIGTVTAIICVLLTLWAVSPSLAGWLIVAAMTLAVCMFAIEFLPQLIGAAGGFLIALVMIAFFIVGLGKVNAEPIMEVKQGINIMQKMDADTCNEVESDELELIYNEQNGWKLKLGGKIPGGWTDSVTKGSRTITFICQNGYFIRRDSAEPIMDGQVEYKK